MSLLDDTISEAEQLEKVHALNDTCKELNERAKKYQK